MAGGAVSWLLSHVEHSVYDFAELENGARNGVVLGAALAAGDLFYVQAPRGAWLRRLGFGRTILAQALLSAGQDPMTRSLRKNAIHGARPALSRASRWWARSPSSL